MQPTFQACNVCGSSLELVSVHWHRHSRSPSGFAYTCKPCVSEKKRTAYLQDPEPTKAKRKERYWSNREAELQAGREDRARTRAVVAPLLAQARAQAAAALEAARQQRREVLEDLRSLRRILAQDAKDGRRLARRAQRQAERERLRAEKAADPVYQAERETRRRELQRIANDRRTARRHALRPPRVPMTSEKYRVKRLAVAKAKRDAYTVAFVGPPTRQSAMRTWRLEHPGEPYPVGWLSERRKIKTASASPRPAMAPGAPKAPRGTPGIPRSPEARLEAAKARQEARDLAAAGCAWDKAAAAMVASIRRTWRKAATPAQRTAAQLAADARKREERESQLDAARQRDAELRASLEVTRAAQAARRQAEGLAPITYQRDRRPEGRSFLVKADAEQAQLTAMPSQTASADDAADRASLIARANTDVLALSLPRRRPV